MVVMNLKVVIVILMMILVCLINTKSRIAELHKKAIWDQVTFFRLGLWYTHTHIHRRGERERESEWSLHELHFFPMPKIVQDYWLRVKNVQGQCEAPQWQFKHSEITTCIYFPVLSVEIKWNKITSSSKTNNKHETKTNKNKK